MAYASPFLICDPPDPATQVDFYIIYQDGVAIATFPAEADGSLKFDLSEIVPGAYTWTIKSKNVWEESPLSNPYISPSSAGSPQNTRMEP